MRRFAISRKPLTPPPPIKGWLAIRSLFRSALPVPAVPEIQAATGVRAAIRRDLIDVVTHRLATPRPVALVAASWVFRVYKAKHLQNVT